MRKLITTLIVCFVLVYTGTISQAVEIVPEIDKEYDLYLPVNKKIGNIVILLNESINELTNGELELSNNNKLYNSKTKEYYSSDVLLINTNIRNGSTLVLTS